MRTRMLALAVLLTALGAPRARGEDREPLARVVVEGDGFVRLSAADLAALGFGAADDVRAWRGNRAAPQVPREADGDVVFLALDTQGPHTRRAVYWLRRARRGDIPLPPDAPEAAPPPSGPVPTARTVRVEQRDRVHGDLAAAEREVYDVPAPTWFLHRLPAHGNLALRLPPGSVAGSTQRLTVKLHATQPGEIALQADHGERTLGVQRAPVAAGGALLTWEVPDVNPAQEVVLRDLTPASPAPARDVSDGRGTLWVDHVAWEGPDATAHLTDLVSWEASADAVLLPAPEGADLGLLRVAPDGRGLGAPAGAPSRLAGGIVVEERAPVAGTRVFAGPLRTLQPERLDPVSLPWGALDGVEHLIVSTQALLPEAQRLAEHRRAHGLSSRVIAAREVYRALGAGEEDPELLRQFLRELRQRPEGRALKHVLLCGDAALDRSDLLPVETIPALMARTQYNGATPADTLYVEGDGEPEVAPPVVGRLPFREPRELAGFVDRLIAYETQPARDDSRRTLRFLASEGRFGTVADALIEGFFKRIVGREIPPAYDVEVTFASPASSFMWPPQEFNAKVIEGINAGALFYTYVGHGFAQGFDSVHVGEQRFPILHVGDAEKVDVRGTPPVVYAIACTTAQFDAPKGQGLGERLLGLPRGPIAYVGATRICHPAANAFLGRSLARAMFRPGPASARRLGDVAAAARTEVLDPSRDDAKDLSLLTLGTTALLPRGTSLPRLKQEAFWLYNLLGDPGTLLALPEVALEVEARRDGDAVAVSVRGVPDGTEVSLTLELPRERMHPDRPVTRGVKLADPTQAEAVRTNHRHANDKRVLAASAQVKAGVATARFEAPAGARPLGDPGFGGAFQVKAHAVADGRVALGAALLLWEPSSPDGAPTPR